MRMRHFEDEATRGSAFGYMATRLPPHACTSAESKPHLETPSHIRSVGGGHIVSASLAIATTGQLSMGAGGAPRGPPASSMPERQTRPMCGSWSVGVERESNGIVGSGVRWSSIVCGHYSRKGRGQCMAGATMRYGTARRSPGHGRAW